MIISWPCDECERMYQEGVETGKYGGGSMADIRADLTGDGIVKGICSLDHNRTLVIREAAFQILFEIGLSALHDGYYREAVLSFYAAAERFYEFWLRCVLRESGLRSETTDAALKDVRLSERQLGAFVLAYYREFGRKPELPADARWVKIRNNVAHMGEVPTREEASKFGSLAYSLINGLKNELLAAYPEAVRSELDHQQQLKVEKAGPSTDTRTGGFHLAADNPTPAEVDIESIASASWLCWRHPALRGPSGKTSFLPGPNADGAIETL